MSYLVLARKWRPQTFDDLVGQAHVSRTLANAIAQDRVAHAFLFTGVRGVGKTTSARILAKALNCAEGPTATPCLRCGPCVDIAAGFDVDVQEIDGASYNGVDEVRRLQESLPYRPQRDRFKIFIIDEVHMLSSNAWNAFLKTLEEPPAHVKFIFATTEVQKVPITILSRCQRYDFKMIDARTIGARLRHVLAEENIAADDAAIGLLAREAAGSMRDAMSLLDQAIAWDGTSLVGEQVAEVLGVASRSAVHELVTRLVEGDAEGCLRVVGRLVEQGYDLPHLTRNLLAHLRDVVVAKVCAEPGTLLDLSDAEQNDVRALAERAGADDLVRLHQGVARSYDDVARSSQPRGALEMTLLRLARRPPLVPLDDLMAQLADLERRINGDSGPGGGGGARGAGPRSLPDRRVPSPTRTSGARTIDDRSPTAHGAAALDQFAAPALRPVVALVTASLPAPVVAPLPASVPEPETAMPVRAVAAPSPLRLLPVPLPVSLPPTAAEQARLDCWKQIVDRVEDKSPALAAVLRCAVPLALAPEGAHLGFPPDGFLASQVSEPAHVELLTGALRAELGEGCSVKITLAAEAKTGLTLARVAEEETQRRRQQRRQAVTDHPLVQAAIQILGAELRDVDVEGDEGR